MSATLLFYLIVLGGWVLMLVGFTLLLRAFGIDDDWRPFR